LKRRQFIMLIAGLSSSGRFIPLVTIPMAIVLLVAMFTVHLPNGFSSIRLQSFDAAGAHFGQPGFETDLLYLAGLIALCLGGAGPYFGRRDHHVVDRHSQ
jgi:putative oxidoreductase